MRRNKSQLTPTSTHLRARTAPRAEVDYIITRTKTSPRPIALLTTFCFKISIGLDQKRESQLWPISEMGVVGCGDNLGGARYNLVVFQKFH